MTKPALDFDTAAEPADDSAALTQTKAHAGIGLRRIERVKDPLQILLGNAGAIVSLFQNSFTLLLMRIPGLPGDSHSLAPVRSA